MMRPVLIALLALAPATPSLAAPAAPTGVWRNAADSVRIRVAPCGVGLCGTVVAASERAKADAAAGGTDPLIGTSLFRDLRRTGTAGWAGQVYVPDLGRSFDGTLEQTGTRTLVATGCLLGNLGCRSQTWTRVGARVK